MIAGLILAKSDSKRLPKKNILPFDGSPMFLANVKKCLTIFDVVYVSSDSDQILTWAQGAGALTVKRGKELCGDVPDIPVFQHALENMTEDIEGVVAVHANNPTILKDKILLVKRLIQTGEQEVMTCYPMERTREYKDQFNKINGSIRGFSRERLENYADPYRPEPSVLVVDDSLEVETPEDYEKIC